MKWNTQIRALVVCALVCAFFTAVSYRLFELQVLRHEEFAKGALKSHTGKVTIPARRGEILDRNGEVLALNAPYGRISADAKNMRDPALVGEILERHLTISRQEIDEKLATKRIHIELQPKLDQERVNKLTEELLAKQIRTVHIEAMSQRRYPHGATLCHTIGFLGYNRKGVHGIEKFMEDFLHGVDGERSVERDAGRREIAAFRGLEIPARDGANVVLTIDMGLQDIVEQHLDNAVAKYRPKTATVVLTRPATGEVLAMARRPAFDPQSPKDADNNQMLNGIIAGVYEPGSTFKIVAIAAALNDGLAELDTLIYCENGILSYSGRDLKDHKPFGELTVREILAKSSNIGTVKLALQLGERPFYNYTRRFGFGFRTGIELPGEIPGLVRNLEEWDALSISRMPIGQSIGVTPIQLATALNVIANRGKLIAPRVVLRVVRPDGALLHEHAPVVVRQVVSEQAAEKVAAAMHDVVGPGGTGRHAVIPPYNVCGKSGTAQKPDSKSGGYLPEGRNILSFMGFFPYENPELSLLVVVDEPVVENREENAGGALAGPLFAAIGSAAARYLNIPVPSGRAIAMVGSDVLTANPGEIHVR